MFRYAPRLDRVVAPARPLKLLSAALVVLAFFLLVLVALTPGGLLPGVAESTVQDGRVIVAFEDGDRYFWVLAATEQPLRASGVLDAIDGEQSITRRTSFDSSQRDAYDEADGGDDFLIEPDYLYEVGGVFSAFTLEAAAAGEPTGTDFMDQIKEGSTRFARRLTTFVASVPGIVWDDLKQIHRETKELFTGKDPTDSAGESGDGKDTFGDFIGRAKTAWPILVGIVVLVALAPLLGLDSVITGFISAIALAMAGFWVLAVAAVIVGLLADDDSDGGGNWLQNLLMGGVVEGHGFAERNPQIMVAVVIFVLALAGAGGLAWLGHANLAAGTLLAGGILVGLVMSKSLLTSTARVRKGRAGIIAAAVLMVMSGAMSYWMSRMGFSAYAWALLLFASVMALMGMYAWKPEKATSIGAWFSDKGEAGAEKAGNVYGRVTGWVRMGVWLVVVLAWLLTVAFARGQALLGLVYASIGVLVLALLIWYVAYRSGEPGGAASSAQVGE